jgi:hypothetical protein
MCIIGGVDPQRHARSKSAKSTHRRAPVSPFAFSFPDLSLAGRHVKVLIWINVCSCHLHPSFDRQDHVSLVDDNPPD